MKEIRSYHAKLGLILIALVYLSYCAFSYFYYSKNNVEKRIKPLLYAGYKKTDIPNGYRIKFIKESMLQRYCGSEIQDGLTFGDDTKILNPHGEVPMPATGGRDIPGVVAHLDHGHVPIIPFFLGYYTATDLCFTNEGILAGYKTRRYFYGMLYMQLF